MTAGARAFSVVAVVAVATWGEGGAAALSLVVAHLLLAAAVAVFAVILPDAAYAPSKGPALAWLGFAVLAGAGAVVAPYAYAAWLTLVEIVAFGALYWLASGNPLVLSSILAPAFAALASVHGIVAVVQKLSGSARPASTFLNPNHLAAWLAAAALFLGGAMLRRDSSARARSLYGAAVACALSGIFVTGSRGAVASLAAGAVALVAVTWSRLSPRARRMMLAATLVLVVGTGAGVSVRFRTDDDPYRFHRTRIWAASFRAALERPLSGTGPGQFAAAAPNLNFPLEDAPLRFARGFRSPHSDVLRAVCEFGFPAGLFAFAAVVLAGYKLFLRRAELTAIERGAVAALFGLIAQCCVDDLTTRPAITMTAAAFAGLLLARPRVLPTCPLRRATAAACTVLVVLALGVGELAGYLAWSAAHDLPRGRLDAGELDRLRRSLAWNPMQPAPWQRLAEHFVGDGRTWRLPDYAAAREAGEHAVRLQPEDAFYARAAARVEATAALSILPLKATRERASNWYDDAMRLARTDATIPLEAAKFLLGAGDPEGAARAARQAIAIEPRAATPRLWLARAILEDEGRNGAAEAQRVLDEALRYAPREGEIPSSSYHVALRAVDPQLVESLRSELTQDGVRH
jgi:O-antigen ligase